MNDRRARLKGNRLSNAWKKTIGRGNLFGKTTAHEQHWGGSQEAFDADQQAFKDQQKQGWDIATRGVTAMKDAASTADQRYADVAKQYAGQGSAYKSVAQNAGAYAGVGVGAYQTGLDNLQSGRGAQLDNAAALEASANNMVSDYQRTADRQAALQREANNRAAISAAGSGRGGALAFRNATGAAQAANVDAMTQAEITRAQETNQLLAQQNAARAAAAQVRAGVAGQDTNTAQLGQGMYGTASGVQQGAMQGQLATTQGQQGVVDSRLGAATGAAGAEANLGQAMTEQGNNSYLTANSAQLGASTNYEQLRVQSQQEKINKLSPYKFLF